MKFKVTKIAAAVAAGLGVSLAGMNAAQADTVLFPYFAVSDTVTTLVSTINLAQPGTVSAVNPQTLHYRFYYKRNAAAESLTATCEEFDVRRVTSPNDIVTFDLLGHAGDDLGVLFEPADRQLKADYTAANRSFALMSGLAPARGFLIVDNEEAVNQSFEGSLFGDAVVLDFAEGAAWGYQAYNASPQVPNSATGTTAQAFLFEDAAETTGEVLAGSRTVSAAAPSGGKSPAIPVSVQPIVSDLTSGDTITKFFVTPIAHSVRDAAATPTSVVQANGQLNGDLRTQLKLQVEYDTTTVNDVMFDRDENPVSGQTPQNVVCVGAVQVQSMLSAGAFREIGNYGGWTGVQVLSPGALATFSGAVPAARTKDTNQAVVIKLEYNGNVQFLGETFPGAFNNALWLRYGVRESVANVPAAPGTVLPAPAVTLRAAKDGSGDNTPVFVANDFAGNRIPVLGGNQISGQQ